MTRFALSNIQLRSNLCSGNYQQEMHRITVFELKDILRRNEMLAAPDQLTPRQKEEWKDHLFWGQDVVSLDDDDRRRAWLEGLAETVEPALAALEERPTYENAFELLIVTEQLKSETLDSWHVSRTTEWSHRVRAVLARDEFHLPPDVIDQRLAEILGVSNFPGAPLPTLLSEESRSVSSAPDGAPSSNVVNALRAYPRTLPRTQ